MAKKLPPVRAIGSRPRPPAAIRDALFGIRLAPADGLAEWVKATFLEEGAPLHNEAHRHLLDASVGFLWASSGFVKQGRRVLGMTERAEFRGHAFAVARAEQQIAEWFPDLAPLDFIVTLDALYCDTCLDVEFCALVEHELFHCGHAVDEFGVPKWTREGKPKFAIRGHDIEEFVGIVERYGVVDSAMVELAKALAAGPQIAPVRVAQACGTCQLRVA